MGEEQLTCPGVPRLHQYVLGVLLAFRNQFNKGVERQAFMKLIVLPPTIKKTNEGPNTLGILSSAPNLASP